MIQVAGAILASARSSLRGDEVFERPVPQGLFHGAFNLVHKRRRGAYAAYCDGQPTRMQRAHDPKNLGESNLSNEPTRNK